MAKSFSDPESHAGTVYKVTNWELAGETKGYSQDQRPNAALNLALTRNALLAIIPFKNREPLSLFFEIYRHRPALALDFILKRTPFL